MEQAFAERIEKKQEAIQSAVTRIEQESNEASLHDLQMLLVDMTGTIKRDPGVEAAANDLFAAAAAVVIDRKGRMQPVVRKLRLLRDAGHRLNHRLSSAAERTELEGP